MTRTRNVDRFLDGVRVIDLSMGWSGPLAARHLADMGAQVIKVEACQHLDWWRGWEGTPAGDEFEESVAFNTANRNKLGITLDLTSELGVALLKRLVELADIVLENNAAGVLPRLGLDYASLRARNPELIMASMPAFGGEGPWREYRAYGSTVEQASGIPHLNGAPDGPPTMQHVALEDPVAGLNAASALLVALWHKRRTGEGQRIDLSQVECLFPLAAHGLLEQSLNGRVFQRPGNELPGQAPYGVYPCKGDDRWVAVTVSDDAAWLALCTAIERPDLADDPSLRASAGRDAARSRLDEALSTWTREHDPETVMSRFQAVGVPAAAVRYTGEMLADPQLRARGFWQTLERDFVGPLPHPAAPYRFRAEPLPVSTPAPTLGQHSRQVLTELLGLEAAELDALEAQGVIGTRPARKAT